MSNDQISEGQRQLEQQYSIKKRHFIGNTSMDATLSLLMANQAKVKPGIVTFDPFVGTGSLLIAAAHFGSYVVGGDINANIIHGRGKTSRKGVPRYRGKAVHIRQLIFMFLSKKLKGTRCLRSVELVFEKRL